MKITSLVALFLFAVQFAFSQSEKPVQGKVTTDGFPTGGIEVINQTNGSVVVTDVSGKFSIPAKVGDVLIFAGKNYTARKITLNQKDFGKTGVETSMNQEAIQLVEVEITKEVDDVKLVPPIVEPLRSVDNILNNSPNNMMVYNGSIKDGLNFVAIGKMIGKLFKKKKDKVITHVEMKEYVSDNFNKDFFLNTLKLKEDEIEIFLEFCYADPKMATLVNDNNVLETSDFLISKKEEFRKLKN
ncbi:hypothetical protein [Flavobacterium microcysteis]|uniref:Carboxypeptidase-like regulatory domain-containing protein n=1 Tax=Flavobacterium microcysteis TaxID=2596891 RepID=A0A501QEM1_9FLAO|nr:hypothetical protein [Flavobacterium microcysteis]TPD70665.1 hypothetical protein FJA49_06910 [Flavobacterium microcysteis]